MKCMVCKNRRQIFKLPFCCSRLQFCFRQTKPNSQNSSCRRDRCHVAVSVPESAVVCSGVLLSPALPQYPSTSPFLVLFLPRVLQGRTAPVPSAAGGGTPAPHRAGLRHTARQNCERHDTATPFLQRSDCTANGGGFLCVQFLMGVCHGPRQLEEMLRVMRQLSITPQSRRGGGSARAVLLGEGGSGPGAERGFAQGRWGRRRLVWEAAPCSGKIGNEAEKGSCP